MAENLSTPRVNQALLFQRLRGRLFRNSLRVLVERSRARMVLGAVLTLVIWGTLFGLSLVGFIEVRDRWHLPLDAQLLGFLLNLMFMTLSLLLVFSTGIILYSSLFNSQELTFLLVAPVEADQIFAFKFQGALAFSSWGFLLLGTPILIAYGLVVGEGAPWYFYALLILFFFGFVLLPGSVGALLCLLLVSLVPRRRKQVVLLLILLLAALLAWWAYDRLWPHARHILSSLDAVTALLGEFSLLRSPLMPAHWIAAGLQSAALADWPLSLYYLALVWSNGLMLYVITAWVARRLYRPAYNRLCSGGTLQRRYGGQWLDHALGTLLGFLHPQTRLLIIKDFRTFRRDPAQWAQVVILLGLIGFYFSGMRHFYQQDIGRPFQNGVSLLNLTATAFLMCAYTSRFIYPMLSLEGRKFWILGLLPLERERLLWGKFGFSATWTLLVGEGLVIFSNLMLSVPWPIVVVHSFAIAVLALGLSGLSVGLGATMPNFRESDPSKVAVGFGGTMNLIAGLLFLIVIIVVMALPWHLRLAYFGDLKIESRDCWLGLGVFAGWGLGWLTVLVPLRKGAAMLKEMEF